MNIGINIVDIQYFIDDVKKDNKEVTSIIVGIWETETFKGEFVVNVEINYGVNETFFYEDDEAYDYPASRIRAVEISNELLELGIEHQLQFEIKAW